MSTTFTVTIAQWEHVRRAVQLVPNGGWIDNTQHSHVVWRWGDDKGMLFGATTPQKGIFWCPPRQHDELIGWRHGMHEFHQISHFDTYFTDAIAKLQQNVGYSVDIIQFMHTVQVVRRNQTATRVCDGFLKMFPCFHWLIHFLNE